MLRPGIYRHYKGKYYEVQSVGTHSETGEKLVVYNLLYGDFSVWLRPYVMFVESVTLDSREFVPRFEFVCEATDLSRKEYSS